MDIAAVSSIRPSCSRVFHEKKYEGGDKKKKPTIKKDSRGNRRKVSQSPGKKKIGIREHRRTEKQDLKRIKEDYNNGDK